MVPEFEHTYVDLNERLYEECQPEPVEEPETVLVNDALARQLGFDPEWLSSVEGAEFTVGNRILDGSRPVATAYAGDQFGQFQSRLGDGRAHLLGEVRDDQDRRMDLQLKGSGRTPFSRQGDGRAPLGPVLREYIISEAMNALGVPTTRSLVAATTGETVRRREGPEPGAVLVRVARSHIRVGTFQYFAARGDTETLRDLTVYSIDRHYPELDAKDPVELLDAVVDRQANLIARWQLIGFIHGVMNTDNTLISGETIDYGPCAFMNEYDPDKVYSSIDRRGRYAFKNQPTIARWNLRRFAGALTSMAGEDSELESELETITSDFTNRFQRAYDEGLARKLGLDEIRAEDEELVEDWFRLLEKQEVDFTLAFRRLTELARSDSSGDQHTVGEWFDLPGPFDSWLERWKDRLDRQEGSKEAVTESMAHSNPAVIPRNYQVNNAIDQAVQHGNYQPCRELIDVVTRPYSWPEAHEKYLRPPSPEQRVEQTFCGT